MAKKPYSDIAQETSKFIDALESKFGPTSLEFALDVINDRIKELQYEATRLQDLVEDVSDN